MDCSLKPFTQLFTYLFPSLGCEKILFPMTIVSPMVQSLCPSWLQAFMAATISDSECRQHLFQWKGDWQKCISGIFNFFITFFSRGVCFLSENSWSRDNKRRLPQGLLLSGMDQLTFLLKGLILQLVFMIVEGRFNNLNRVAKKKPALENICLQYALIPHHWLP